MAVIAAGELHNPVAPRGGSGDAHRTHGRFGTGIHEANPLDRGHEGPHPHPQLHFEGRRRAEAGTASGGGGEGSNQTRRCVSVNERSPGHDIVDIRAPVHVLDA